MVAAGFVFVPGTRSGLALRVAQCAFSGASCFTMLKSINAVTYTRTYIYLIFVMLIHTLWSFAVGVAYLIAMGAEVDIHRPSTAFLLALIDGAVALLSLSAASASASVTVLFVKDMEFCGSFPELACSGFQLAVVLGFVAWLLQAISAFSNLCLMVKVATPHHE